MAVTALLVLAGAMVACGGNRTPAGTTATTSMTAATDAAVTSLAVAELDTMLLAVDELPAGWESGEPINQFDLQDSIQSPCEGVVLDPTIVERLRAVTGIQFQPSDGSSQHLIEFLATGAPARLTADLDTYFEGFAPCPTVDSATAVSSVNIEALAIPDVGDQRAAFVLDARETPDSPIWHVRTATVRVGGVAMTLGLTEILSTPDQALAVSDSEFVELIETAAAKLAG